MLACEFCLSVKNIMHNVHGWESVGSSAVIYCSTCKTECLIASIVVYVYI